jgi:putative Holliday junction resolvase
MPHIVGIDFGDARIGVAVSDEGGRIAFPLDVLYRKEGSYCLKKLKKLLENRDIESFVVGLPFREDGEVSEKASEILRYADSLSEYFGCDVHTWDERYSTAIAEQTLLEDNVKRSVRKDVVDKIAAQIILQSYLDHVNHNKSDTSIS